MMARAITGMLLMAGLAPSLSPAQIHVTSSVVAAGGGVVASESYRTTSTIGGFVGGGSMSGVDAEGRPYHVVGGFAPVVGRADTLPVLMAALPSSGPASGATALTLTGSRLDGLRAVTIGGRPARHAVSVDGTTVTLYTPPGMPGPVDIVLTTDAGSATLPGGFTYGSQWFRYLAEGAVSPDWFDTRIALLNPAAGDVQARLTYLVAGRDPALPPLTETVTVPGAGRVTVDPVGTVAQASVTGVAFSTVIETDREIAADRTMSWPRTAPMGSHTEQAVEEPSIKWYFAEGATHGGFDLFYLLQNPNPLPAHVDIRFLPPAPQTPVTVSYVLPAGSRTTVWVDHVAETTPALASLAATDLAAEVTSRAYPGPEGGAVAAQPVLVERAMYLTRPGGPSFQGGTASTGVLEPLREWHFAEGATGPFFDHYLLLANPRPSVASVGLRFLLNDGRVYRKAVTVAPDSRVTVPVDLLDGLVGEGATPTPDASARVLSAATFSTIVTADQPIVAERAMWWPEPSTSWAEGHASAGSPEPGTRWALAGGEVVAPGPAGGGVDTYVLIANTSAHAGLARVTPVCENGDPVPPRVFSLPPTSRTSVNAGASEAVDAAGHAVEGSGFGAAIAGRRCGFLVEALPHGEGQPDPQLIVERATYHAGGSGDYAAGSGVAGTRLRTTPVF